MLKIYMDLQCKNHFRRMMMGCILTKHTDNKVYKLSQVREPRSLSTKTIEPSPCLKLCRHLATFLNSDCMETLKCAYIGVFYV